MLVHFAVNAWILRSKCKSEADFSNYVNNSILQGNVLTKGTVAEVQECFAMCIQHPSCQSVNYLDEALDNCELNSNIKENVLKRDFIAKQGWTYFATNYSVKNVSFRAFSLFLLQCSILIKVFQKLQERFDFMMRLQRMNCFL